MHQREEVTMAKKKMTEADRERIAQMMKNAERTRQLAEKGQAELDRRKRRDA
jgi:hypothetical protein